MRSRKRRVIRKHDKARKLDTERKDRYGIDTAKIDKFCYGEDMTEETALIEKRNEFFLAATSLNDHHITKIIDKRIEQGLETFHEKETFVSNSKEWTDYIRGVYGNDKEFQVVEFSSVAGMIIERNKLNFIDYSTSSNSIDVKVCGSRDFVESTIRTLKDTFTVANCYIEWMYSSDGSSLDVPLLGEKLPVSEMYPFLEDQTVEEYYQRFLDSSASILLLIGPPGTGKTTFIRGLLHYASMNAMVTYDDAILEKDYVFARFIEEDTGVMVLEDADNFLKSRTDGNLMMHRFLNVGDGLITVKGKKMVFSTNLPSVKDVDPALIRPGRCFDILEFRNYTKEEAQRLADKLHIPFVDRGKNSYSLAEVFHEQAATRKQERKVGFV